MNICVTELCVCEWQKAVTLTDTVSEPGSTYSTSEKGCEELLRQLSMFEHGYSVIHKKRKKRELKSAIIKNVYSPNMYFAFFPFVIKKLLI